MKKTTFTVLIILMIIGIRLEAQQTKNSSTDKYGKTLNIGIGVGGYSGYYGYIGRSLPVLHVDYEFDVAKNFTLAPFINFYTFKNEYYWGNHNYPYQYYYYRETVVPIGVKGAYYFDELLKANSKWDFYLGGSLGFAIVSSSWDSGYYGDKNYYRNANPLFLDIHVGTEYHLNSKVGLFLDLSSGVSTFGLSIH